MPQRSSPRLPAALSSKHASGVVVVVVVGLACLLLAGVPAVVHVALFAGAMLALSMLVIARVRRRRPVRVSVLALPLLTGALLTTVSLLPLPHGLRALLSAESTDRLDRLALLLQPEHAAAILPVLAFDPPEAALALLRLLFGAAVVVVTAHHSRDRSGRSAVFRAIGAVAFVVGVAVLLSSAVGIPRFFEVVGVPVNPNHRARVCGALALLCLGRAVTLRSRVEASWFGVAGVTCAVLVFVTMSKGGIAAFVVGGVTLIAVVVRGASPSSRAARLLTPLAGAAVVVGGLFLLGERGVEALTRETLDHPERLKTFLWEPASRVAAAEPLVGVGNNGFGVAFPSVLQVGELDATLTYSHAENTILQTLADHGVVGGGLLLLLAFGLAVVVARALRAPGELVAVPAIVFLLVGDVFDFVLETPAGLGLMAIALGLLAGRLAAHREALLSLQRTAAVVVVVVVAGLGAVTAPLAVRGWRYALDDAIDTAPVAERAALLERALAAHPSDATYATRLAIEARRRRDPEAALRFSNRALVLWPAFHAAHLEAARALVALKRPRQAMLEYREAWRVTGPRGVIGEVTARTTDPTVRRLAVPRPEAASDVMALCEVLVREQRPVDARACVVDAAALPDASDAHQRRAIQLALDGGDLVDAAARVTSLKAPLDGEDAALAAQVLAATEGLPAALSTSSTWIVTAKDARPLLEWRLREQRRVELYDDAEATLSLLRPLARTAAQASSDDLALVDVRQKRGDTLGAIQALERALAQRPRDPGLLLARLKLELSAGRLSDATATLRRMKLVAPNDRRTAQAEKLVSSSSSLDLKP